MLTVIAAFLFVLAAVLVTGCGNRTVFVNEGAPMRVGPSSHLKVYHRINGEWTLSQDKILVPEGWYLVSDTLVEEPRPAER